jgi:hypothetical protein
MRSRVDEERPHEDPGKHPADVLEVVQPFVLHREVVEVRDVPEREIRGPEAERDPRAQQCPEDGADARAAGERGEDRRGEEEDEQRPAQGSHHQRRAEVADQDVLSHVRGEQLLVGDFVERPDEGEDRQAEAGGEEGDAIPAGSIGPPAAAQPHDSLSEEQGCDRTEDEREHPRIVPSHSRHGGSHRDVTVTSRL